MILRKLSNFEKQYHNKNKNKEKNPCIKHKINHKQIDKTTNNF